MQRSPAFVRNREAILEAMKSSGLVKCERILELGSGPGEHAPYFAAQLGDESPEFQPTDLVEDSCVSSDEHAKNRGLLGTKILPAKVLDLADAEWDIPTEAYDGCLAINVLHIAPHSALEHFFQGASAALKPGGILGIYDTWTFEKKFVGPNNYHFDMALRSQGFSGVPAIEACDDAAKKANLIRSETMYLPANNQFVIYTKSSSSS